MVTYVFDTSALLRYLDREPGFERVSEILKDAREGGCDIAISAVNWGELVLILVRRQGIARAEEIVNSLKSLPLRIQEVDEHRAARAGLIKHALAIPYADAFGVELAGDSAEHILVTADFDVKPAERQIRIEFLPTKSKA